jgi:hypothetical protein
MLASCCVARVLSLDGLVFCRWMNWAALALALGCLHMVCITCSGFAVHDVLTSCLLYINLFVFLAAPTPSARRRLLL